MKSAPKQREALKSVVINRISGDIDCGRFPIKRCQGDTVRIEADVFAHGHDALDVRLQYRPVHVENWQETPMRPLGNDRWQSHFQASELGYYEYRLIAWVDEFSSWRSHFDKKFAAGQEIAVELEAGAHLIKQTAQRASGEIAQQLEAYSDLLSDTNALERAYEAINDGALTELMRAQADRAQATLSDLFYVWVDRPKARFSTWYELFPRSWAAQPGEHGTFQDVIRALPYIQDMGFDVIYLPPIHPIGQTHRKGPNNTNQAGPHDIGSPWGIGDATGGHKAIHPKLGTLDDFRELVKAAKERDMEIALDIALQCSPDHPYVKDRPQWFKQRPDGSLRYAENPPKRYEDIYPLDFETEDREALYLEIQSIFDYWIQQGVRIFRVDNPHTKPFEFWRWLIEAIRATHPDVIFLAEAFTRPKVMHHLAKVGFTQSYTYFTWRNTAEAMRRYLETLTNAPLREYFRPNFWPNTPDILHADLQHGGRPAFKTRFILAATLSSNYGIYGPAFELCLNTPREPGSEEYNHSEKYEIKTWALDEPDSLKPLIRAVNAIRRAHPALQQTQQIAFHGTDNDQLLCYSKNDEINADRLLMVVSFDFHHRQAGWTQLDLEALGLNDEPFIVEDLLTGARYTWQSSWNYVELSPELPAHIFKLAPWIEPS